MELVVAPLSSVFSPISPFERSFSMEVVPQEPSAVSVSILPSELPLPTSPTHGIVLASVASAIFPLLLVKLKKFFF